MNKPSYQDKDPTTKNFQALMKEIKDDTRRYKTFESSEFTEHFKNQCNIDFTYNSLQITHTLHESPNDIFNRKKKRPRGLKKCFRDQECLLLL